MIRTFNLRGINAEEYARLCRLIDVPPQIGRASCRERV